MSEPKLKSFEISKMAVWEAYRRVKANKGGAGVDGESIAEFEQDLKGNLYKLWNRLSSGSYFPPPVRAVEIPKRDGSSRTLGVPTVSDRIAQTVVRGYLEPCVEPVFHEDSYGYRPGRSAHQALGVCRERCWRNEPAMNRKGSPQSSRGSERSLTIHSLEPGPWVRGADTRGCRAVLTGNSAQPGAMPARRLQKSPAVEAASYRRPP